MATLLVIVSSFVRMLVKNGDLNEDMSIALSRGCSGSFLNASVATSSILKLSCYHQVLHYSDILKKKKKYVERGQ